MSTVPDLEPFGTLSFQQALDMAEVLARNALPTVLHERLSCAVALVKAGAVLETDEPHTWTVASASTPGKEYTVNGHCPCEDAHYRAHKGMCKHVLAVLLARKTLKLMERQAPVEPQEAAAVMADIPSQPAPGQEPLHGIPVQYVTTIQGRPFVRFEGLLAMAHERGLVELTTTVVTVTADFAVYRESGDGCESPHG